MRFRCGEAFGFVADLQVARDGWRNGRTALALGASLVFSCAFAAIAAKYRAAERVMIPLLDILQSIQILGFLSITVTGFIALAIEARDLGAIGWAIGAMLIGITLYEMLLSDEFGGLCRDGARHADRNRVGSSRRGIRVRLQHRVDPIA